MTRWWRSATLRGRGGDAAIPPYPHTGPLTSELAAAVENLLAGTVDDGTSHQLAVRAGELTEQLTRHLARIVGEIGITALFKRSVVLSTVAFPWLGPESRTPGIPPIPALRTVLALQPPALANEAYFVVLSTFVALLGRLIGEPLVRRMLQEVWPAEFHSDKEPE